MTEKERGQDLISDEGKASRGETARKGDLTVTDDKSLRISDGVTGVKE